MFTTNLDNEFLHDDILASGNSWGPEDDSWDDDDDEDFDDRIEDLDDLHQIQVEEEEFNVPDADDDDHLPEEDDDDE